jgi:uncharacterized protein YyaL (SSP411 family)
MAIETLVRLAVITGEARYESDALKALRPMTDLMTRYPGGFGRFLCALDFHLGPVVEVALLAPPGGGDGVAPLAREVFGRYLPNRVVLAAVVGDPATAGLPLLADRAAVGGKPTAYVCRHYTCDLPATDRETLARQLDAA